MAGLSRCRVVYLGIMVTIETQAVNCIQQEKRGRLISRIKYRQFGIMVTTSYVDSQAYREIKEDGHPIMIVNAKDIADILRNNGLNPDGVRVWLTTLNE